MKTYFSLKLTQDQFLSFYAGAAKDVVARSWDGRTIRFPANILRPFVTREGVQGDFVLEYDSQNKFKSIQRVQPKNAGVNVKI